MGTLLPHLAHPIAHSITEVFLRGGTIVRSRARACLRVLTTELRPWCHRSVITILIMAKIELLVAIKIVCLRDQLLITRVRRALKDKFMVPRCLVWRCLCTKALTSKGCGVVRFLSFELLVGTWPVLVRRSIGSVQVVWDHCADRFIDSLMLFGSTDPCCKALR